MGQLPSQQSTSAAAQDAQAPAVPLYLHSLPLLQGGTTALRQVPVGDIAVIQPAEDLTDAMHQEAEAYRVVAVPHKPKSQTSTSVRPEDYALTE